MTRQGYARLSNGFYANTKVRKLAMRRPSALGLYALAISFCSDRLTDGRLSEDELLYQLFASEDDIRALCDVGLFESDGEGYVIHDYLEHQNSSQKVIEKRQREQKRHAERANAAEDESPADGLPTDCEGSADSLPTDCAQNHGRTLNTKTQKHKKIPLTGNHTQRAREAEPADPIPEATRLATQFESFWQAYPKKLNRRKAEFAFKAALKRTSFPVLLSGAQNLAADPNLPEERFVPQASAWLDADGWLNPPYRRQRDGPPRSKAQDNADFNRDFISRLAAEEAAQQTGALTC